MQIIALSGHVLIEAMEDDPPELSHITTAAADWPTLGLTLPKPPYMCSGKSAAVAYPSGRPRQRRAYREDLRSNSVVITYGMPVHECDFSTEDLQDMGLAVDVPMEISGELVSNNPPVCLIG